MKASLCFHPFARAHLRYGRPTELLLVLDPTTQEDKVVMVSVAVWFRGAGITPAWAIWPGNTPLEGDGFWKRIDHLLDEVAPLLPAQVSVTLLADRAFGCPAFIDLLVKRNCIMWSAFRAKPSVKTAWADSVRSKAWSPTATDVPSCVDWFSRRTVGDQPVSWLSG